MAVIGTLTKISVSHLGCLLPHLIIHLSIIIYYFVVLFFKIWRVDEFFLPQCLVSYLSEFCAQVQPKLTLPIM